MYQNYIYICTSIYIYLYLYIYLSIYIYTYIRIKIDTYTYTYLSPSRPLTTGSSDWTLSTSSRISSRSGGLGCWLLWVPGCRV